MPFVNFSDDLRVGHAKIDEQHASLFDAVNRLHDALRAGNSRQELAGILAFLRAYTVEHFQMEEACMRESGFPELASHKAEHDALVQQVQELEAKHTAGSMTLSMTVMTFLRDWLAHHITVEDRKLADHLRRTQP